MLFLSYVLSRRVSPLTFNPKLRNLRQKRPEDRRKEGSLGDSFFFPQEQIFPFFFSRKILIEKSGEGKTFFLEGDSDTGQKILFSNFEKEKKKADFVGGGGGGGGGEPDVLILN